MGNPDPIKATGTDGALAPAPAPAPVTPSDTVRRLPPSPLTLLAVTGMIGVGKSTLVRQGSAEYGIPAFIEYVAPRMLADYIHGEGAMTSFHFQNVMMLGACVRLKNALSVAESGLVPDPAHGLVVPANHGAASATPAATPAATAAAAETTQFQSQPEETRAQVEPQPDPETTRMLANLRQGRVVMHERPPAENRIFALANYLSGKLSEEEYTTYEEYVDDILEQSAQSHVRPQLMVRLWAPAANSLHNMQKRGMDGEQDYDQDCYLPCLHHCYFLDYLAMAERLGMVVVDWSRFGTVPDVLAILRASHLPSFGDIGRVTHSYDVCPSVACPDDSPAANEGRGAASQSQNLVVPAVILLLDSPARAARYKLPPKLLSQLDHTLATMIMVEVPTHAIASLPSLPKGLDVTNPLKGLMTMAAQRMDRLNRESAAAAAAAAGEGTEASGAAASAAEKVVETPWLDALIAHFNGVNHRQAPYRLHLDMRTYFSLSINTRALVQTLLFGAMAWGTEDQTNDKRIRGQEASPPPDSNQSHAPRDQQLPRVVAPRCTSLEVHHMDGHRHLYRPLKVQHSRVFMDETYKSS